MRSLILTVNNNNNNNNNNNMNEQTLEIAFKKGFVKCAMEKYAFGVQDISDFLTRHKIDPQWAGAGVGAVGGGLLGGLLGPKGHTGKSMLLGALGGGVGGYYGGGKFPGYLASRSIKGPNQGANPLAPDFFEQTLNPNPPQRVPDPALPNT